MRKFFLFALVTTMFAACATDAIDEQSVKVEELAPETLTVSFEEADSRIQLNEAGKTVWTKGDEVSVFYKSYDNLKFKFDGETGDRSGTLTRVDGSITTQTMDHTIVAYPYSSDYRISLSTGGLDAMLPATQYYAKDSYGIGSNLMVAQSEFAQFSLKNVCGWLKIQLTGNGQVVKSITLKGNNNEQVAGLVHINTADATSILASVPANEDDPSSVAGNLVLDGSILTSVTLDCGEGVTLGTKTIAFYIALPPQSFDRGLTIEVACSDGSTMTKTTENAITIARNAIQPMAAFAMDFPELKPANNEIWYTATKKITPYKTNVFGANIALNEWDATTGKGIIKFDGDVTSIGHYAFNERKSLTSISIPNSVTSIGDYAFFNCSLLTSITTPDGVISIGNYAFYYCTSLTSVTIGKSVISIGNYAFQNCDLLTSITIPNSVTSIGDHAFWRCTSLTNITIPDSVTSIRDYAFCDCSSLTSITLPDSVTEIGIGVFHGCTWLISVSIPGRVTKIKSSTFSDCISLTSITIPNSVTSIGGYAFSGCTSLRSITIPNSVTSIGQNVFDGCFGELIVNCNIPSGTYSGVFSGSRFTKVTIGNSVTSIGSCAFSDCTSLKSVTIPDSITEIGYKVFYNCTSLKEVYCKSTTPPAGGSDMFNSNASGRKIYVPRASVEAYKAALYWSDYASYIEGYDF